MKKLIALLLLLISVQLFAQSYPITGITISLPANPDAMTTNWSTGTSLFIITATAKGVNGRVDVAVESSKILVTIKKSGSKICGAYTSGSAPSASFNALTKVWRGSSALSLLGQECTLPPGEYDLCVQFFGNGPTGLIALSEEKCKAFSIRANEQQNYQAPQAIMPTNGALLNESDILKPITFRWTPVVPKPQEPSTYRLKVWQLMQGQNGTQAMKANQPIITKDVDNLTQATVNNLITGPCKPPYLCDFIWNVQALNRDGKPIGGNNGTSESLIFSSKATEETIAPPTLRLPANSETIATGKQPLFTWLAPTPTPTSGITYKIKIVEIKGDQSPENALRTNKPFFEKDSLEILNFQYPSSARAFETGRTYAWGVQAFNRERKTVGSNNGNSEVNVFKIIIIDPSVGCFKLDTTQYKVVCNGYDAQGKPKYKLTNLILTNIGTNNGRTGLHNTPVTNYITPTGFIVAALTPLSATPILPNNSINISFEINGATGTTASFVVNSTIINPTNSNLYCDKTIGVTVDLPNCACNPCKDKQTVFGTDSSNSNNVGQVNMLSTVSHGPNKVIKVTAQIVNFERLGENGCLHCTKDSKEFGNYIGGSLNGNGGIIVKGSYGKQIQWQFTTPTSISGYSYDLNMMFPPLTEVSCCKDSIKICTKWSFTDENCVTCDTLICKVIVREYKIPPPFNPNGSSVFHAAQMAKLGEPYTSWYNQKATELPKNFIKQVEEVYRKSTFSKGEEIRIEAFTENMKQAFNSIQNLKTTGVDAVWNAINANQLNTQCGNGDFESGLNTSEWSGAKGTISGTNDPSLGTYSNGFSPTVVGINLVLSSSLNNHSLTTLAPDPTIGTGLQTTSGSSTSIRIGNTAVSNGSEMITKKFTVNNGGIIKFMYASVFQDPGHGPTGNGSFWVKVYDNSGNAITNKVFLEPTSLLPLDHIVANTANPFFQTRPSSIVFRDWTCAKIDLSSYIGQTVTVALINTDCSGGLHFGYTYIDNWCGNCEGASTGSINIKPITEPCIDKSPQVCVDYTLPKIGTTTGSGKIKLEFYQNGVLVPGTTLTSPTLTSGTTFCFTINPAKLPCNGKGYDVVATGNFTVGSTPITVTSPDPIGSPVVGIVPGQNNDLYCCSTPAEICCQNFIKTVTATTSMIGNSTSGYNSIKFVPTFKAGPKPIKKVVISIINFETSSSNKECLTCESNTRNYGSISVPSSPIGGGGKDPIEGMTYPSLPVIYTCLGCPPTWQTGRLTHEVTWGSNSGLGYDLMDGAGDQSTTFFVHLPKKSTLSCCDDTIKICVKYSFTDIECKTCDTIICYKIINRQNVSTVSSSSLFKNYLSMASANDEPNNQNSNKSNPFLLIPFQLIVINPKNLFVSR